MSSAAIFISWLAFTISFIWIIFKTNWLSAFALLAFGAVAIYSVMWF